MKKYLFFSLLLALFPINSYAISGPYLGGDILLGKAQHKYGNQQNSSDSLNGRKSEAEDLGFGLNAGFKIETESKFILGQEIFFDHLNVRANDFDYPSDQQAQDELTVNYRFGVKFKFGYKFTEKFDLIGGIAMSAVDYDNRSPSTGKSHGSTKAALLYEAGIYYSIIPNLTLKAQYDYQSFTSRHISPSVKDEVQLGVARVGVLINF